MNTPYQYTGVSAALQRVSD